MANNIPISLGGGAASIAAEDISGVFYQRVELLGAGGSSVASIDPAGGIKVSIAGVANIAGSVAAVITGTPNVNTAGSVVAFQGTTPWTIGSVYGNISGSVVSFQGGTWTPNVSGSVVAFQGTTPWAATNVGSIITTNVGSVITVLQAPSIVGTYAEDAAHTQSDKGVFILAVRNDLMPSVTSSDLDYSPIAVGPVGEVLVANAPISKWIQGTADLRVVLGASVTAVAAPGASIFTYITGAQVANFGPSSVLLTWGGGLGSILGYTIAPAGGGSNIIFGGNALKTGANSAFTASINGTASVLVTVQGFTAKI